LNKVLYCLLEIKKTNGVCKYLKLKAFQSLQLWDRKKSFFRLPNRFSQTCERRK